MNMEVEKIPVLLLTGYLGSGKTTLLNYILTNRRGIRFAVIVNDIGEVNIDASLIQKGGIVGQDNSGDLVALQNGCICCTLKMDLVKQVSDIIATGKFDYIVIEASGICEPEPIARTICTMEQMVSSFSGGVQPRLDCIVTVVDALRMQSEFDCGDALRKKNLDEEDIENLIIQQIEFCNIILLNKISDVKREEADRIKAIIRAIQPSARIIECDYAGVDLSEIIYTDMFDFEKVATSASWIRELEGHREDDDDDDDHGHHSHDNEDDDDHDAHEHHHHDHHHHHEDEGEAEEYGIGTMVYYRRQPFDFESFDRFVAVSWPKNVIRAKGIMYFSNNRDMSLLFEQAGVQKKVTEAGYWYATAPEADLKRMLASDPSLARDWDETYGDRMVKIVFIGQHLEKEALTAALDRCLAKE